MINHPAKLGSASVELCALVVSLQNFYDRRDVLFQELIGRDFGRNRLTEDLVRRIVVQFCRGHVNRVQDWQAAMTDAGSRGSFRASLRLLEAAGVVIIKEGADRRERLVWPSSRLIYWYEKNIPLLAKDAVAELKRLYGLDG